MSKTGTAKKKHKPATGRAATIRMYNVGFGDAFLLILSDKKTKRRILFDCGSIEAAPGVAMKTIVDQIISDVTDQDGVPRIDVVVATHRHKDHVSGFANPKWDDVEVKEVWMPWTEHPTDPEARRIRDIQSRLALGLNASLGARAAALNAAEQQGLRRYQDIVTNALMLSNDTAMKTLHSGFSGNPKRVFLPGKQELDRTFETNALPGVKIHVMGPSRNRDVIRDMDPPAGASFLRMQGAMDIKSGRPPTPFGPEFQTPAPLTTLSDTDQQEMRRAASSSDLAVAVALDKAVNGTSLMLMLEIAGTFFLFPGDAQWGTWLSALEDPQWRDLLGRVSFYKIGHHGSHNATPRVFVEDLIPSGICAMASTLTREIWPDIPRTQLLSGLAKKNADVVRSDHPNPLKNRFENDNGVIQTTIAL